MENRTSPAVIVTYWGICHNTEIDLGRTSAYFFIISWRKQQQQKIKIKNKWEWAVAHPQGGSSFTVSRSNWNLEMLVFVDRGKPENPEKNLSQQRQEPTTNSTHIWRRVRESKPGHNSGRRVLSPLRHPCCPIQGWFLNDGQRSLDRYTTRSLPFCSGKVGWEQHAKALESTLPCYDSM